MEAFESYQNGQGARPLSSTNLVLNQRKIANEIKRRTDYERLRDRSVDRISCSVGSGKNAETIDD